MAGLDPKARLDRLPSDGSEGSSSDQPSGSDETTPVETAAGSDSDESTPLLAAQAGLPPLADDTAGGLGRHLGLFSTTFLIIGRIIGTGIFSTPSSITASVGSVGAALLLWLAGLVLAACGLQVWLEFGCMLPRSGGEKVYLEAAYPRPRALATVVFAVHAVLLGFTASGCIVFAANLAVALGLGGESAPGVPAQRAVAVAVLVFVTLVHALAPRHGVRLMNVIGSVKVAVLLFIIATGAVVLAGGVARVPDPLASFRDPFAGSATSGNQYAAALFKVLNAYAGWSNAAYVLNEVRHPVRTLKIAGPLGLGLCGLLYLLANVAYYAAATPAEIAGSGVTVAAYVVGKVFGEPARRVLSAVVAVSALGNVLTITFAQARVNQELAKEGVLPWSRFWAATWPAGAPSAGLLLHFVPSLLVLVAVPFGDAFSFIIDVEGYPGSVLALFVGIGLFVLRRRWPDAPRPFRVAAPVALFFIAAQSFLLVAPFLRPPGGRGDTSLPYWLYPLVGLGSLLAGVVYWFVTREALPRLGNYRLEPERTVLADGTVVFELRKKAGRQ